MNASFSPKTDFIIQGALIFTIGLAALISIPVAVTSADETHPTTAPARANVPATVVGSWVEGSISPTTYWDTQTGRYQGNARSLAQYFIFNADGTYKHYVYIEMRMYNMVTQVWTQMNGQVEFADNTFTLIPTAGHYKTDGTRKVDRPMTAEELAEKKTTYNWRIEDNNDQPMLVIPFDDGSAFRLRRDESNS